METVNEVKKLLDLNFDKVITDLKKVQSLDSINQQSHKLNEFFRDQKFEKQDNVNSKTTTTNGYVEPIIDIKYLKSLQEFGINMFEKNKSTLKSSNDCLHKKPFLRKGDGLKRFNNGNLGKNEITSKVQLKKSHLDTLLFKDSDQTHKIDRKRKVKFVTEKTTNLPPVESKVRSKSLFERNTDINYDELCERINKLTSKVLTNENSNLNDGTADLSNLRLQIEDKSVNTLNNKSKDGEIENLTNFQEPVDTIDTIRIKEEIRKLEKRLIDLKAIKNGLGEIQVKEKNMKHENIATFLEDIRKDICTLNEKISSISDSNKQSDSNSENNFNLEHFVISRDFSDIKYNADSTIYTLTNGDKIVIFMDQTMIYQYLNGTVQTIYPDGLKVIQFHNGQIEKVHINGTKQIIYPNNQQRIIKPDKTEEIFLNDGRVFTIFPDGTEKIDYENGDVELKTSQYTKRVYKDGNTKTVYSNGCEETLYSNGRIRFKDILGNIIYNQMA